jgi:hypothetical protein
VSIKTAQNLLVRTIIILLGLVMLGSQQAAALTQNDIGCIQNSTCFYDPSLGACGVTTGSSGQIVTTESQAAIAKIIIGIAKTDGLGEDAAQIGLMVGIDESKLTNLPNENVPLSEQNPAKQGDGSNGTSLGVFQQQITDGWSTISSDINNTAAVNQLMTPAYAAEAFFGSPYGSSAPSALSKGLQDVSGWQSMQPWVAAQAVQHSSTLDGSNYERYVSQAQSLLNQYWSSAPAVSLPVPISGGSGGGGGPQALDSCGSSSGATCNGNAITTTTSAQVRQEVVCIAEQELTLWQSGQLKPGTDAYFKYSQNRPEEWCADFASWVYNQAGYSFGPAGSPTNSWNISWVPYLLAPPQDNSKFTYHALGSGYTPQPGDLAIHGSQHVNIVIAVTGSTLTLIGGDQSNGSYPINIVSEYSNVDPGSDDPPITGYVSPNQ